MNLTSSSVLQGACGYCGCFHSGMCSRIKSIEYYGWGGIKRVELHGATPPPTPLHGFWGIPRTGIDVDLGEGHR